MLLSLLKDIFRGKYAGVANGALENSEISKQLECGSLTTRRVLNVGGNSKSISIPSQYDGWQHLLLDIDPRGNPDVLCDARSLAQVNASQFDAIYCSHNLEHYFRHEVKKVLAGFHHVLKDDGFAHIRVPDMGELMKIVVEKGLDIEEYLYESPSGPIHVIDVIYGWRAEIEHSGNDFFAHKTGFTQKSLVSHLKSSGFPVVFSGSSNLEVFAIAFKHMPTDYAKELFNLPESESVWLGEIEGVRKHAATD